MVADCLDDHHLAPWFIAEGLEIDRAGQKGMPLKKRMPYY
jgi:hypothetical protein